MPNQLIPHLFRTEFSKIVAVLCKNVGLQNIQWAEDIVSDTFLAATEGWGLKGVPENPTAWLYKVAKNKAIDSARRKQLFQQKIGPEIQSETEADPRITHNEELDLSTENIQDSQLRMFFAVCHPSIQKEAQVALALRILCGFGIEEIAQAFLSNKSTINKRLQRAKNTLKQHNIKLELPKSKAVSERLESVLSILYLLFNEGYYSTSNKVSLRKELCFEAMRLCLLLLQSELTNLPQTHALLALFCFHASRFEARISDRGEPVLFKDQDSSLWDKELVKQGEIHLNQSGQGKGISKYHLEAIIAFWHTQIDDGQKKWEHILQTYNQLLQLEYSPIAALNRTYALAKVKGKMIALKEALKIDLKGSHLYHTLLAELYLPKQEQNAKKHLKIALELAKTEHEKKLIEKRLSLI